jgi:peptidoglycan DL-endopeptidase CwlO
MKKKFLAGVIILTLLAKGNIVVLANPLEDVLRNQQNQLQQERNQLTSVEDRIEELEFRIEEMDVQIEEMLRIIENNKRQIAQTELDIQEAELLIKEAEEEVEQSKELLSKRVRAMYKSNNTGYLAMLFQSKNMSDLLSRIEWVNRIVDNDKKLIKTLQEKEKELISKKDDLDTKLNELILLKNSNDQKLALLNRSIEEQRSVIEELRTQESVFSARIQETQNMINTTMQQIQEIRRQQEEERRIQQEQESRNAAPRPDLSRGSVPISSNAIIAYASNYLGTPYVWGGTTPNPGFDCSGFTQYVFAHFGIRVGRTTWDQIKDGVYVPRNQLQPGDLVFYGRGGNPTHMGIYAGNGTYIHAPRTGDVVKISRYDRSDYITARRVWQ